MARQITKVVSIPLHQIIVKDRGRKDLGDITELANSIQAHGLLQPITVAPLPDGNYRLVTGERRFRAHAELKLESISCLIRDLRDDKGIDLAELELVENVHRKELTWQERCTMEYQLMKLKGLSIRDLAEEIGSSKSDVGRHIILGEALAAIPALADCKTAFDAEKTLNRMKEAVMADELKSRAEQAVKDAAESDVEYHTLAALPPEEKPKALEKAMLAAQAVTNVDDLAERRLRLAAACYNIGDCIDSMARYGEPQSFHFAEVDPPYGIDLQKSKRTGGSDAVGLDDYNEVEAAEYFDFLCMVADEVFIKLTTDAFAIFWFGPTHQHATYRAILKAGFKINDVPAIWAKKTGQTQQPSLHLANCYEPFYVARKGTPPLAKQGRSNIFQFDPVPPAKKYHPTQRPIELMQEILSTFVFAQQMRILVPFLGSGVTIRAAFNLGMLASGWDLSEEYRDKFLLQVREDALLAGGKTVDKGGAGGEGGSAEASEVPF